MSGTRHAGLGIIRPPLRPHPRELAYILDTFPIVRRKDEEQWGVPGHRTVGEVAKSVNVFMSALNVLIRYQTEHVNDPALKGPRSMMKHKWRCLFGGLASGLIVTGWWLYNRRPRERTPSHESLDDPEVARAYGRVAMLPQMQLLRWFVAHRAAGMTGRGEAADLGCGPGQL
ncbi:MAG: hypothetical protein ISS50_04595 [Anaerolineae bacterium]|nr:hypothetical protein [Anaerolineae bacterium]